jgi:hypothetical protein
MQGLMVVVFIAAKRLLSLGLITFGQDSKICRDILFDHTAKRHAACVASVSKMDVIAQRPFAVIVRLSTPTQKLSLVCHFSLFKISNDC